MPFTAAYLNYIHFKVSACTINLGRDLHCEIPFMVFETFKSILKWITAPCLHTSLSSSGCLCEERNEEILALDVTVTVSCAYRYNSNEISKYPRPTELTMNLWIMLKFLLLRLQNFFLSGQQCALKKTVHQMADMLHSPLFKDDMPT